MSEEFFGLIGVAIAALFGFIGMLFGKRSEAKRAQKAAIARAVKAIQDTAVDVDVVTNMAETVKQNAKDEADEVDSINDSDQLADEFNSAFK